MNPDINLIYDTKRLLLLRYPHFGSDFAKINMAYKDNLKYHTASTDGENIYFDYNYFSSLDEEERIFLMAHEALHIKFAHHLRLTDKNGKKKDLDIWNEATDAIINANLVRDGFKIKKGYVYRKDALKYTSEELYEIIYKEKKNNKDNNNSDRYIDDHSMWEDSFKRKYQQGLDIDDPSYNPSVPDNYIDENEEFEKNRKDQKAIAEEYLKKIREEMLKNNIDSNSVNLGNVGNDNNSIDWRILLRREMEKSEMIWSQRRSIAENNYAYRLEEYDIEEEAETEVMIDVSGSVSLNLVKHFLRMIKPILKSSKLKVGCFNARFWGMVNIKTINDIDNFVIPAGALGPSAYTEDWDLAVRSFTRKKEINKIVFTDGYPCPGNMPKEDLKNENIIWIVYGNTDFKPCCGKVINITETQLKYMQSCVNSDFKGKSR